MGKKAVLLCYLMVLGICFIASCSSGGSHCPNDYWVSPTGSDSASGNESHPFLTIARARDALRSRTGVVQCAPHVTIKGGTYRLSEALTFTAQDSGTSKWPVTYQAASGEIPIISGAAQITGWTLHDAALNIWQAQTTVSTTTMPRQLYVNGVRVPRARTVDYPNYYFPTATGYTYLYILGTDPQIPPTWGNPTAVEAVTATQWKMMRCPVAQINNASEVVMQTPCWTNANVFPEPWNFQLLSWWENAYEFLDEAGEWYLDPGTKVLYYKPRTGEDMSTAAVELPVLEKLLDVSGDATQSVSYLQFDGLSFSTATWLSPNTSDGYALDQSGFHLKGTGHSANTIGHDPNAARTPGNLSFTYAQHITFENNTVEHMGAVGLDFDTGSQNNQIVDNTFNDISGAGIQLGGITAVDARPTTPSQLTADNTISNNLVQYTGQEFYDTPGIYIGFTTRSTVAHNDIQHVPWSGIAIGWGWGLLDPGGFAGLPHANPNEWGTFTTPTAALGNQILHNHIQYFLEKLWDGGAIYSTGFQGTSMADGQLIAYNVAENKSTLAGGNTFYTDGGSRYVTVKNNVSLNNPQGFMDFGPCLKDSSFAILCLLTDVLEYGQDMGGCVPYGDLRFEQNYLRDTLDFYDICTNSNFPNYPVGMSFVDNVKVSSSSQVPTSILSEAGRQ